MICSLSLHPIVHPRHPSHRREPDQTTEKAGVEPTFLEPVSGTNSGTVTLDPEANKLGHRHSLGTYSTYILPRPVRGRGRIRVVTVRLLKENYSIMCIIARDGNVSTHRDRHERITVLRLPARKKEGQLESGYKLTDGFLSSEARHQNFLMLQAHCCSNLGAIRSRHSTRL